MKHNHLLNGKAGNILAANLCYEDSYSYTENCNDRLTFSEFLTITNGAVDSLLQENEPEVNCIFTNLNRKEWQNDVYD